MKKCVVVRERKLRDSGNSTVLTIPPEILGIGDLEAGDEIEIEVDMASGEITSIKRMTS